MTSGLLILVLLTAQNGRLERPCSCRTVSDDERTRWGNNHVVLSSVARLRVLRGVVKASNDELMADTLVEVFTDPGVLLLRYSPPVAARRARQRRIAACLTNEEGEFCFTRLPAGQFELRCSAAGFQTVSQGIRVGAKGRVRRKVIVALEPAT